MLKLAGYSLSNIMKNLFVKIRKWIKTQLRLRALKAMVRETEKMGLYDD